VFNDFDMLFHFQLSPLRETPFKVPLSQTNFTVTQLDPYKTYKFAVSAKNSLGSSVKSAVVTATTQQTSKLAIGCAVQ